MGLRLITPPAEEPVSLDEAKAHLRITGNAEDTILALYIAAARQWIDGRDGWLGRAILTQTWELVLDEFPASEIRLPFGPVQQVSSVKYDDAGGIEQTIDPGDYTLDATSSLPWILPAISWPATLDAINSVRVQFVAGYPSAADVPAPIRAAILLLVKDLYGTAGSQLVRSETVEGVGSVSYSDPEVGSRFLQGAVANLLSPYRVFS